MAYLPDALENAELAREIIRGMPTGFRLPPQSLVVTTWQAYMFEFVVSDGTEDPPLQTYIEGEEAAGQVHGVKQLAAWLRNLVRLEEDADGEILDP